MAISFSRPDPSSPASVADATFGTGRRGFDQQEVRDFLRMVGAELARLQERERFLERELRAAQSSGPALVGELDDEAATRLLGEEAARILQAAREGGASIRAHAEDGAAQLLREAGDDARRMREEAELEAGRKRADAVADAEAELAMAKQQGREMVEEARAYRERVLGELARRRDLARQQLEQLIHGRDRLLQAFERARLVAVDVVAELSPLGAPEEYVDLTPTTGPVPIMVPSRPIGEATSVDDIVIRTPEVEVVEVVEVDPDEIDDDDVTATDVDALFAKLRAVPTEPEPDEPEVEVEDTPFGARDAAVTPLIVAAGRKLKRVLADEQNEVLDALRRNEPVGDIDALLAPEGEQSARYADAITVELIAAVEAGAASVGGEREIDLGPDGPLAVVRGQLADDIVGPLRERLARGVRDGEQVNDTIAKQARGVYREWKTQRIDEHLDDLFRLAYCHGAFHALEAGRPVAWVVDPAGPPSPDCEDNALAGAVASGDAFPSGHLSPPMHPGCRCLLVPVDR